jgi:hypothetical protein
VGYVGGYWRGGVFVYNRSVNRIDTTVIHNTYYKTVEDRSFSRVSYNGGRGGIDARPTARQQAVAREPRIGATATQVRQERLARSDRQQLASENRGRPAVAATQRPGDFQHGSVAARGAAERNASYRVDNSRRNAAETRSSRTRNSGTSNSRTGNTAAGTTRSRERTPTRENGNARVTPREEKAPTRTAPGRKAPAHTSHSTPERNSNARTEKAPSHTEHAAAAHTSHATPEPTPKPARNTPEVKESHNARPPAEAYSHGGQPSHAAAPRENTRQEHGSTHAAGRSTAHSSGGGNHGTADVGHGGGSHSEPKQK